MDPQTRTSMQRGFPLKMNGANQYFAGPTRVYGTRTESVQALDTKLDPIETLRVGQPVFGNWSDDPVYFDQSELDPATLAPGRIVLARGFAVDSPVVVEDSCDVF